MQNKKNIKMFCSLLMIGYYVMMYMTSMMFSTYMLQLGYSGALIATLLSVSSGFSLLSKPFFTRVIEKGKCRLLAGVFTIGIALGYALFLTSSENSIFVAVAVTLLGYSLNWSLMDLTDSWVMMLSKQTGEVDYGKVRAFGSICYALTSLVYGAAVAKLGNSIALPCILFFSLFLFGVYFFLPDPTPEVKEKEGLSEYKALLKNRRFLIFMATTSVTNCCFCLSDSYIPVLLIERGGTSFHNGLFCFMTATIEFFVLRRYTEIADKIGTDNTMTIGLIGFGVKAFLVAVMPTPELMLACGVTQIISLCMYLPGRLRFQEEEVDAATLPAALTLSSFVNSLFSSLVGNPLASAIIEKSGTANMLKVFAYASAAAGILFIILERRKVKNDV